MPRTTTGTVYALIDPRDNKIRYIGKTEQAILTRLAGHLAQPTNPAMRVWINSLSLQGVTPRIETVATVSLARLGAEEQRQIRRHAKEGHRLLNSPYYREHLDDLIGPPDISQPSEPTTHPLSPFDRPLERWLFGRLARTRAEGGVSACAVVLLVVAVSPLYAALVMLRGLLGIRLVRVILGTLICGWPFWVSGFDRAVRDLLLARLPVAEWSALWTTYAAGPLSTLASDLVLPVLLTSALMSGIAYSAVAESDTARQNA